jgi:glycosyltransferase involved in cell wall biosynthesis
MRIAIANEETWGFLPEIYADLKAHHHVTRFERRKVNLPFFYDRINRFLFQRDLTGLMKNNDIVFFEWASHLLAAATNMPKQSAIVTRLHRYEMYEWVDRINWDHVDKIILVSQAKKQEFADRFPAHAHKAVVITEAVDPDKYRFAPKPFNGDIGILCHLTPRKRVYELVLAFYELRQQRPDLHLHIGGGPHVKYGDYYFALRDLVKNLNLTEHVTFYGHVSDAKAWYHNVDIFIGHAYSEGLQVSPLEAMASGCYVLSHRWAGADELLPAEYLYYTDQELQQKILDYCNLSAVEKNSRLSFLHTRILENFNIHHTKIEIRQLLEAVGRGESVPAESSASRLSVENKHAGSVQ